MKRRTKAAIVTAAVVVLGGAGATGVTLAAGGDDAEAPITGDALIKASAAALAHTGEGRVTDTEVGDEDSYYEVEVTLDDGGQVDVQLDKSFHVVSAEADDDAVEDETD
jgi:uncharacterized membrane protein YkoI